MEGGEKFKTGGKPGTGKCLGQKNAYVWRGEGWEPSSRDGPIPQRQIPQDGAAGYGEEKTKILYLFLTKDQTGMSEQGPFFWEGGGREGDDTRALPE